MKNMFILSFVLCVAGCVSQPTNPSVVQKVNAFYNKQQACTDYLITVSNHALNRMADISNIFQMREWLNNHPNDQFSKLVSTVQIQTLQYGVLYPEKKSDQIKISSALYHVLRHDFSNKLNGCDVDVGEIMGDRLYFGVHGAEAPIFEYIRAMGIREPAAQRRAFMVGLMAGRLPPKWRKNSEETGKRGAAEKGTEVINPRPWQPFALGDRA